MGWKIGFVSVLSVGLLAACGTEPLDKRLVFPDETRCLSCSAVMEQDEQQQYDPKPRVIVSPEILMFYPSSTDSSEFEPKPVTVTNAMGHLVYVTSNKLLDGEDDLDGTEGSDYFAVDPIEEYVPLLDGESTEVWVEFLGSERQRSAVLIIHTTSPSSHTLEVDLTGKYFF
jgi:hypothetical protein